MSEISFHNKDTEVRIDVTDEKVQTVFDKVIAFYVNHNSWFGESIMQSDAPQLDAAPFLAQLVDEVIKPEVIYTL